MWSMSFLSGTVGIPSNGKSMLGTSSKTSACCNHKTHHVLINHIGLMQQDCRNPLVVPPIHL